MSLKIKADGSKQGAILAVVMIVTLVVTSLGSGMIALNGASSLEVSKAISASEAFWTAEAGLALVEAIANNNRIPFTQMSSFSSSVLSFNGSQFTATIDGRTATVTFPAPPGYDNSINRIELYDMTSTGTSAGGFVREVTMQAEIQTFASYMHASNWEQTAGGTEIYFGPSDVMNGTVYVNDELNIYGTPQFLVEAYTAVGTVNYQNPVTRTALVDPAVFQDGLTLGADALDFEDPDEHLNALQQAANGGGISLNGSYIVVFNDNATVTYRRRYSASSLGPEVTLDLSTRNGAIYISGDAYISGEVNGSITLAARSTVYIVDDLTYASATAADHSNAMFNESTINDALGIIAKDGVLVSRPYSIRRNDINIHGSILVTEGGFGCERRYQSLGNPNINLYGGITQYRRGIVGQLGSPPTGFSKNYRYDSSLMNNPPAQFPYSAYTFNRWKQTG